jgi:hypothetical protein
VYLGMQQCSTWLLQMLRSGGGKGLPLTEVKKRVPTINIAIMVMLNRCANLEEEAMTKNFGSTSVVRLKLMTQAYWSIFESCNDVVDCLCAHMMTP